MSIVYKIRRVDGLFSMGGSDPKFNKVGKIWKRKGDLSSHLTCVAEYGWKGSKPYDESEVVKYELTETIVGDPISIQGYLLEYGDRKAREELERHVQQQARQKKARYNEYLRLQEEFENE